MELTGAERFFKKAMGVLALIYFGAGAIFILFPDQILQTANVVAGWAGLSKAPVASDIPIHVIWPLLYGDGKAMPNSLATLPPDRLWVSLAFSMMVLIGVLCLMVFINPRKYIGWTPLLLVCKLASSGAGLASYLLSERYFANLLVPIVDFPIFLFVAFIYWRAARAKPAVPA